MLCFPNAKINIGLNIISKRSDGYHNIETVFWPIGLSDILEFVPLPGLPAGNLTFTLTGFRVEGPEEDNLCIRAYRLLSRDFQLPAIDIHLHKIIPMQAGLGGGSSDAAFMLKYLNVQFGLQLDEDRLCNYASELGSDCAFFIKNKPLFGYERGNRFMEIPVIQGDLEVALVNPGIHISTFEAYEGVRPGRPLQTLEELIAMPVETWKQRISNDFERSIVPRYPEIGMIKDRLYRLGAVYASMTGSGSSVYGLFIGKVPDLHAVFKDYFYWTGPLSAIY
jgi:4-diphosphocytidyl-2-C-methyl-D-erythritol kinase